MPFPEGLPTTLVTYAPLNPSGGGAAVGTIDFAPTVPAVSVPDYGVVFTGRGSYRFNTGGHLVDADGAVGVRLLPNNVDGANPQGWLWLVTERLTGLPVRSYYVWIGADQEQVDLAAVQEVDSSKAEYVLVQGPPGPPGAPGTGGGYYEHTQSSASATWQVTHSLGYRPNISIITGAGQVVYGDIEHTNTSLAVITFPTPLAGTATCS